MIVVVDVVVVIPIASWVLILFMLLPVVLGLSLSLLL